MTPIWNRLPFKTRLFPAGTDIFLAISQAWFLDGGLAGHFPLTGSSLAENLS